MARTRGHGDHGATFQDASLGSFGLYLFAATSTTAACAARALAFSCATAALSFGIGCGEAMAWVIGVAARYGAAGEDVVKVFKGLIEELLLVDPGRDFAVGNHCGSLSLVAIRVQSKMVVQRLGFLARLGDVVHLDCDLEFTPSCLVDDKGFARLCVDHADMLWDGLVELKLDALEPVRDVGIVDALDKDGPAVRVVIGDTRWFGVLLGVKRSRGCAVDKRAKDLLALDALAGCG